MPQRIPFFPHLFNVIDKATDKALCLGLYALDFSVLIHSATGCILESKSICAIFQMKGQRNVEKEQSI